MSDDFTKNFRANRDSGSLHPACCAAPGAFLKDALGIYYITPQSVIDALTTPAADKTGHRERLVTVLANPPFGAVRHNDQAQAQPR